MSRKKSAPDVMYAATAFFDEPPRRANTRVWSADAKARAVALIVAGMSLHAVEKKSGIPRGTLQRWKKEHAVPVWQQAARVLQPLQLPDGTRINFAAVASNARPDRLPALASLRLTVEDQVTDLRGLLAAKRASAKGYFAEIRATAAEHRALAAQYAAEAAAAGESLQNSDEQSPAGAAVTPVPRRSGDGEPLLSNADQWAEGDRDESD